MTARDQLTMATIVVASDDHISCEVGSEAVLLNALDGEYYGLNPVAASVWREIGEPRSLDAVHAALLAEYAGVSPAECERALVELVTEMLALGIAKRC